MKYDFTSIIDRVGMDALAVDVVGQPGPFSFPAPREGFDVIPMWIADMNFATVPTIPQAIMERAQHALYGYFRPRQEYFDAIIRWQAEQNGVAGLEEKHIGYENGVLGGVVSALGVNTTSFAALLASGGVAVGMALSGNLQNLAGGIVILLFRPFKVGDYIEAQGTGGTVSEIQIFHTILTTPDNKKIYLPNGALSSGNITNYSKEPLRRVDFTVAVEYGEDIDKVRKALKDILDMQIKKD